MSKVVDPGAVYQYQNYGLAFTCRVVSLMRGNIVEIERLDGPLKGKSGWLHVSSLTRQA